jgi:hypothetical protein
MTALAEPRGKNSDFVLPQRPLCSKRSARFIGVNPFAATDEHKPYKMNYLILAIFLAMISLGSALAYAGPAPLTNSLPPKIITSDGITYNTPKLKSIQPDGLLVEFRPDAGGTGLAKLKFAKLPEFLQKQFGYDPGKATNYEHQQMLAMQALTQKLQQDEATRSASLTLQNRQALRPNLAGAVTVSSADPVVTYNHFTPDHKPAWLGSDVASCRHNYQCHAAFDVHVEEGAVGELVRFSITKVRISLGMSCNIIEVLDPYDFIRLHEEQRRKIFEYFYRLGPQLANHIGESLIGREYSARESDFETVKARAFREDEAEIQIQYLTRLNAAARGADLYFEDLTQHDLNDANIGQAYQEAVDKFSKDFLNPPNPASPN